MGLATHWIAWKCAKKCARVEFIAAWTQASVAKVGDYFYKEFQVGLWVDSRKYKGLNPACTTWIQQHVKL